MIIRRAKPKTRAEAMEENALLRWQNQELRSILEYYEDAISHLNSRNMKAMGETIDNYRDRRFAALGIIDLTRRVGDTDPSVLRAWQKAVKDFRSQKKDDITLP